MKKLSLLVFCISLWFISSEAVYSQGLNSVIALDNINVVAVGNQGKIFRSSNAGVSWAKYTIGSINYKCAASFGDDVWLGGSDGKVYKTSKVNASVNGYTTGTTNTLNGISFINISTGYACADGGLVYKTTDGGFNWTLTNTGISSVKLNSINFANTNSGITVGDNGKIYITDNGGASWTAVNSGTTRNLLSAKSFGSSAIVCGEWGTLISVSGVTAAAINSRTNSDIRGISGTSLTDIHIVGGGGFIRNNKNSSNEFLNFEQNPMMANLVSVSFLDANTGYAISSLNDAVIKTTNGGTDWSLTGGCSMVVSYVSKLSGIGNNNGIGNGIAMIPSDRERVYCCYGRNIYRSGDKGETWTQIATIPTVNASVSTHSFYVSPLDTNIFLIASENTPTDKVSRSTDYGATWTVVVNKDFTSYGTPLEIDQNNPSVFYYAPDGGGFYKSTNSGATFTEISGNYPFRSPCDITVSWFDPNVIFLADGVTSDITPGDLFKSTNGGVNWAKVHTNPGSGSSVSEIPCVMNTPFDANLMYITTWSGNLRFKSTNYGNNWFGIQSTSFSGWTGDICREDPTLVLTGRYGQSVSLSTNSGTSWTEYSMPSGGHGAGTMVPSRDVLLSQQGEALLKMKITYTVITNIDEQVISTNMPDKYSLYQNYPNPFNPSTEIRYDIKNAGLVKLNVYDQSGKNISTLVNAQKNPGSYAVKFDASGIASGVYYYSLETNGNILTKKMILVK